MTMTERTIQAGEFKARCLQLMEEVAAYGESIVVTKRGRPVARLVPYVEAEAPSLRGSLLYEAEDAFASQPGSWPAR
jgi:prevent-host-death family protein